MKKDEERHPSFFIFFLFFFLFSRFPVFIIFIRPKYCALPVQHGNYAKERKLAKACDRCCFLLENAPKDTARHGLSFSILSHLLLCLTQLKTRGKRHFVRSTTNDNDGPALCSIFSEAEEKKERRGAEKKKKKKRRKEKNLKREKIIRGNTNRVRVCRHKQKLGSTSFSVLAGSHFFWHT